MTCRDVGLPTPSPLDNMNSADYSTNESTINFEAEQALGVQLRAQLNAGQETAVAEILAAVQGSVNARCFFLDGPGGTGKTFVYNTLARILRGQERSVVLVATTGIAATLLPGGRTAHSCFKIPYNVKRGDAWKLKAGTSQYETVRLADLIIWDEASMAHADAVESVDIGLQDMMQCTLPFGGKVVVLGGDFRQTLPVVRRATPREIVQATIKRSSLWRHFRQLPLTENMRAGPGEILFSEWLLQLGEGRQELNFINITKLASYARNILAPEPPSPQPAPPLPQPAHLAVGARTSNLLTLP